MKSFRWKETRSSTRRHKIAFIPKYRKREQLSILNELFMRAFFSWKSALSVPAVPGKKRQT
jgi:hypothetical protein